ncbi:hypothetical protein ACI3L1_09350 [Deinococcus sp. SM5_A1]|uniref:hypothetical protein n=1 Tax=Deinococcus sp. SM5_A1 TaxID=3379094 RepID=UPI00385DD0D4
MKNALWSLWAVARALFLGIIGQPGGVASEATDAAHLDLQRGRELCSGAGGAQMA